MWLHELPTDDGPVRLVKEKYGDVRNSCWKVESGEIAYASLYTSQEITSLQNECDIIKHTKDTLVWIQTYHNIQTNECWKWVLKTECICIWIFSLQAWSNQV